MNALLSSHQPFIHKRLHILSGANPILFFCPLEYGLGHLLQALDDPSKPLVWLELGSQDIDDPVFQGNKLAQAFDKLEARLLPRGMNSTYVLTMLKSLLPALPPVTLAITNAQYAPELAKTFLALHHERFRVIIQSPHHLPGFPRKIQRYKQDDLRLSLKEASALTKKRLDKPTLQDLYQQTSGAYDAFLYTLHHYLNLSAPLVPGP